MQILELETRGTTGFVGKLTALKEGDLAVLRGLANQPLDTSLEGFDLFTGLWWGLRQADKWTPGREVSWLACKLYAQNPQPQQDGAALPFLLRQYMMSQYGNDLDGRDRFSQKLDRLLASSFAELESQLTWAIRLVRRDEPKAKKNPESNVGDPRGFDWVHLINSLSHWDRSTTRTKWAEQFLNIHTGV